MRSQLVRFGRFVGVMPGLAALLAAACCVGAAGSARAVLLAYEPFNYAPGAIIGLNGGTGFAGPWDEAQGASFSSAVQSGSLSYTDRLGNSLVTSGGMLINTGVTGTSTPGRDFSFRRDGQTLGATAGAPVFTYFSFLGVRQGDLNTPNGTKEDGTYGRGANVSLFDGGCVGCAAGDLERLNLGENTSKQAPLTTGSDFLAIQRGTHTDPFLTGGVTMSDWQAGYGKSSVAAQTNVDYWMFNAPRIHIDVNATRNNVFYTDPEDGEITRNVDWQESPDTGRFGERFSRTPFAGETSLMVARFEHYGASGDGSQYGVEKPDRVVIWMNPNLNAEPSVADADVIIDFQQIEDRALEIINGGGIVNGVDRGFSDTQPNPDAFARGSAYRELSDSNTLSFDRIRLFAGNVSGNRAFADWLIDELRVGTTYADVTPFAAAVITATSVPEPGVLALAAIAATGGLAVRRKSSRSDC
ncbi:MAG: hypothetical protein KF847_05820 [Pirellulales bacterium]|nr:hypothetical protein [Pirellulales bacterium]